MQNYKATVATMQARAKAATAAGNTLQATVIMATVAHILAKVAKAAKAAKMQQGFKNAG